MSPLITITSILKILDFIHDSLHPFFKDEADIKDLDKVLQKLSKIQNQIKQIKKDN